MDIVWGVADKRVELALRGRLARVGGVAVEVEVLVMGRKGIG